MRSLAFGEAANIPRPHAESCLPSLHMQISATAMFREHSCKKFQRVLRRGSILYCVFKWVFKKREVHREFISLRGTMERERYVLWTCKSMVSW